MKLVYKKGGGIGRYVLVQTPPRLLVVNDCRTLKKPKCKEILAS